MAKFYITTPIYYVNDVPHIGHAFTTIAADVLARWHRLRGEEVFFLTGTDEHGEKIQKAADAKGKPVQQFVDELAAEYKKVWKRLNISYDDFIRTSEPRHAKAVEQFVSRLNPKDVYKGAYEGWYCVHDETFFTSMQLKDGKCPECGREVKLLKEESYFFRLSAYQDRMLEMYKKNPAFLSPAFRADEIKNRVKGGLKDLSITRAAVKWGIQFPSDRKNTIYVWVDALINYLTAINWPSDDFGRWWPADVHLVGKEINWFHSVIWPAMLMSAGVEPPLKVFAHGWWTVEGKKMSKSVGNVVDPVAMADKYSLDAFRYFILREKPLGEDGDFSETALKARINGELVADLGNLLNRTMTLAEKFDGEIKGKPDYPEQLDFISRMDKNMENIDLFNALSDAWGFIRFWNGYVNEKRPWALKGEELGNVLYNLLEACRIISIVIGPFMPETSAKMNKQLGVKEGKLSDCRFMEFKGRPQKGPYLFTKAE